MSNKNSNSSKPQLPKPTSAPKIDTSIPKGREKAGNKLPTFEAPPPPPPKKNS